MSRYRIVLECDGPFLPCRFNVCPVVLDDGTVAACAWGDMRDNSPLRGVFGLDDCIQYGFVYEDSPPLVVVADGTGGNPNGVPGSVSVTVERVREVKV